MEDPCTRKNALPDHIYMDCMGFGMGCSCLQVRWGTRLLGLSVQPLAGDIIRSVCGIISFSLCVALPQVTFQGCDIGESRHLYDQMAVICPMMVSAFFVCTYLCTYMHSLTHFPDLHTYGAVVCACVRSKSLLLACPLGVLTDLSWLFV